MHKINLPRRIPIPFWNIWETRQKQKYRPINFQEFRKGHDRFLIIDDTVYLIVTSIKELVRTYIDRKHSSRRSCWTGIWQDLIYKMTYDECLRTQIVTLNTKQGHHLKYMPHQEVAMLSSGLRSETAIEVNIRIMRTFVAARNHMTTTQKLSAELEAIKTKLELLERNDAVLRIILCAECRFFGESVHGDVL